MYYLIFSQNYITKSWHRVFFSDSSCSLLQVSYTVYKYTCLPYRAISNSGVFVLINAEYVLVCLADLLQSESSVVSFSVTTRYGRFLQSKPQPEDVSRLFTAISENFTTLFHILEQKHKDEIFVVRNSFLHTSV